MELRDYWYSEMNKRISRRSYTSDSIEKEKLEKLETLICEINNEIGSNIQLIENCEEVFSGFKASYGNIKGAKYCLALVGNANDENMELKLGYYGEALVLEATSLGIGSCWVGVTYNKKELEDKIDIKDGEKLYLTVVFGYGNANKPLKERVIRKLSKNKKVAKNKNDIGDIITLENCNTPQWLFFALGSARKAPSALNRQSWHFEYDGKRVRAYIKEVKSNYEKIDLGIALLHFSLGAKKLGENVTWNFKVDEAIYTEED